MGMNRLLGEPSRGSVDLEGVNWSRRIVLLREGMGEEEEEEVWKGDPGHELDGHSRVTFPFAGLCARSSSSFSSSSSSSSSPFLPSAPAFYSSYRVRGRRVWRDTPLRRTIRHTMANRTKPCRSVSVASCARNFARFTISGSHPSLYLRTVKAVRECRGERFFLSKSIIIEQH